jgi:rubrerythrin
MAYDLAKKAQRAIAAELKLQQYYRQMADQATNPKVKAVIKDLLLMEEMNEVLLRSLNQNLEP